MSPPASSSGVIHTLKSTTILGLKLYVVILGLILLLLSACVVFILCIRRNRKWGRNGVLLKQNSGLIPFVSKEIKALVDSGPDITSSNRLGRGFQKPLHDPPWDSEIGNGGKKMGEILRGDKVEEMGILGGGERKRSGGSDGSSSAGSKLSAVSGEVPNIGWGRWYTLKELEVATRGFSSDNVVGEGGYGVVYKGVLDDGSVVAVKNLLNNKGQAEKEFRVEVEAIGKVRHKNLVGLVGYCAEGAQRMLVYEYVDNGNLEQWLHGDVGSVSPLSWDIRMKIAIGTAKGLAYLHEGLEPKVVHRDVKSSNILLDKSWNPKVSDFGLAKLLGSGASYVTTRVMGTFGYVSPEYASTGMLSEGSDVYSFGVLLMELITGRCPVDYSRPAGEMNLVDWFKSMVSSRRGEEVVDPLMEEKPSPRALKRALLVCLRCIDMDANKRPKMGQIIHMLEADEFPFRSDHRSAREAAPLPPTTNKVQYPLRVGEDVGGATRR